MQTTAILLTLVGGLHLVAAGPNIRIGGYLQTSGAGLRGKHAFNAYRKFLQAMTNAPNSVTLDILPYTANYLADYQAKLSSSSWDIVIPPYTSGASEKVVDLVNGTLPVLVWGGASETIFQKGSAVGDKVFGTFTPAGKYMDSGLEEIAARKGSTNAAPTKVSFLQDDQLFSQSVCTGARAKVNSATGLTPAGSTVSYLRSDTDATILTKVQTIKTQSPDALVACGHATQIVTLLKQMKAAGFCPEFVLATNSLNNVLSTYTGADMGLKFNIMMPSQWSTKANNPTDTYFQLSAAEFERLYRVEANEAPTYHAASAMLAGLAISKAVSQSSMGSSFDEPSFVTHMRQVNMATSVGQVGFSDGSLRGANINKPMVTEQYQTHGAIEIVAPASIKTKAMSYPRMCNCSSSLTASVPTLELGGAPGSYGTDAWEMWASWANCHAELSKHMVALDIFAYNASTYQATYQQKMNHYHMVIAPYTSGASENMVTAVNGLKPVLVWGGASESIFSKGSTVGAKVFGTFTPARKYMQSGLTALHTKGARSVEFIENDSPFSQSVCSGAKDLSANLGMTSPGTIHRYSRADDATIATEVAHLGKSADVVVICGHQSDTVKVIKAMKSIALYPKAILATNSLLSPASSYSLLCDYNHIMMPVQWSSKAANPQDPITGWSTADFVNKFQAKTGSAPQYHAASALASGLAITKAMQLGGTTGYTESAFVSNMKLVDVTLVVGKVKFDAQGKNNDKPMYTEQFMDTATQIVAPASAASSTALVYPRSTCNAGVSSSHMMTPGIILGVLLALVLAHSVFV